MRHIFFLTSLLIAVLVSAPARAETQTYDIAMFSLPQRWNVDRYASSIQVTDANRWCMTASDRMLMVVIDCTDQTALNARRTPLGSFLGSLRLSSVPHAGELGAKVVVSSPGVGSAP